MTLHRILSELKTLDKRIESGILEMDPVAVMKGSKLVTTYKTESEFVENAKSSVQSVEDLIKRKIKLRSALLKANCTVKVTIAEKEYTIYEAIEMKNIMDLKKKELGRLVSALRDANSNYNRYIEKNESDLEKQISFFAQSNKEEAKPEIVKQLTEQMNNLNKIKILDPIGIESKIKELSEEINEFNTEVDAVLSEINSITTIELDD